MNATVHGGLDEGTKVLVLRRALSSNLMEPPTIGSIPHALILQVALSTLVANGTIERMVGEHHLHHSLAGLVDEGGRGLDVLPWPVTRRGQKEIEQGAPLGGEN